MPEDDVQPPQVQVPPPIDWRIDTLKLSDGTFIVMIQTPNLALRLHMSQADMKGIAANFYNLSTGIHVPEGNGHEGGPVNLA